MQPVDASSSGPPGGSFREWTSLLDRRGAKSGFDLCMSPCSCSSGVCRSPLSALGGSAPGSAPHSVVASTEDLVSAFGACRVQGRAWRPEATSGTTPYSQPGVPPRRQWASRRLPLRLMLEATLCSQDPGLSPHGLHLWVKRLLGRQRSPLQAAALCSRGQALRAGWMACASWPLLQRWAAGASKSQWDRLAARVGASRCRPCRYAGVLEPRAGREVSSEPSMSHFVGA